MPYERAHVVLLVEEFVEEQDDEADQKRMLRRRNKRHDNVYAENCCEKIPVRTPLGYVLMVVDAAQ